MSPLKRKKKRKETTSKHFELFKKECNSLIDKLGLTEFKVDYRHKVIKAAVYASVDYDLEHGLATITLNKVWDATPLTNDSIRDIAIHEVLHLLFADMLQAAEKRNATEAVNKEEHRLIHRLTPLL